MTVHRQRLEDGRIASHMGGLLAAFAFLLLSSSASAQQPGAPAAVGEREGWGLWTRHMADPDAHARQVETLLAFAGRHPSSPFVPLARGLAAWHLLKQGQRAEARSLLEAQVGLSPTDGIRKGARELARAWLTGLDHAALQETLEQYRIHAVRYPERLAELESAAFLSGPIPPLLDRWGNRWEYRTERLRSMPSVLGQRYGLSSRMLEDLSSLETALDVPYASRLTLAPVQVRLAPGRPAMVALQAPNDPSPPAMVMVGGSHGDATVAYASASLVVLHDRLHWKLFLTPNR